MTPISGTPECGLPLPKTSDHMALLASHRELAAPYLKNTSITDDGLQHLAEMVQLEMLIVADTRITDVGISHLHAMRNLFTIDARGTAVTKSGAQKLIDTLKPWLPDLEFLR